MDGFDSGEFEARYPSDEAADSFDKFLKRPEPNREIATAFAKAFCGEDFWKLRLSVYGVKGQARDFEEANGKSAVEAHWPEIVEAQMAGNQVFFYLNKMRDGAGSGWNGTATNADTKQLQTLSVDFDGGLPASYHVEPDIVIRTSIRWVDGMPVQRGQALWLVHDHPDLTLEQNARTFKDAQLRLAAYYDPEGMAGWLKDKKNPGPQITDKAVTDLRRVHRLPGSLHLKDPDNPQLVRFERRYSGPLRGLPLVVHMLPNLPEEPPEPTDDSMLADRKPIAEIVLRETLSYIDPPADEPSWRRIVAAIKATPLFDGDGEEVAVDWSAGRLDRRGKYVDCPPTNYGGDDVVREKFRLAKEEKANGRIAGFGSLVHEAKQAGYRPPSSVPDPDQRADAFDKFVTSDQAGSMDPEPFLLRIGDLMAWPDPKPLVADFLMQGEDACLYSPPKCGKTFVALDVSLSLAAGLPVLGHLNVLRPGEAVVYLSGEGHAGMKRRIAAWGKSRELTAERVKALPFYYKVGVPATKEGSAAAKRYIEGISAAGLTPVLIVIDTMSRSLGQEDENTAGSANAYLNMVGEIRHAFAGCTMLTLAHSGKGEGAQAKGVRGSSAFGGGFDAVWYLEANKENRTAKLEAMLLKDADELGPHAFRTEQVYVDGMGMGAALKYLPLTEYKDPEKRGAETEALLFRIRVLLTEHKITSHHCGWSHAVVAEKLMATPRPAEDENRNVQLAWETEFNKLRSDVKNAIRNKAAKALMGGKHAAEAGADNTWFWYLP